MKLCAIGRFRELAHGYLPHNYAEGVSSCACLAQSLFLFRWGQKKCGNSFIITMLGGRIGAMLDCGEPGATKFHPESLPRQDCSGLFRPVAAVFSAKCPCFQPRQDSIASERPVVT